MKIFAQLGIILGLAYLGHLLAAGAGVPLPAGVTGMLLLLAALRAGWLSPSRIEETANFLMANMAFFFLPPAIEIINSIGIVRPVLLKLAAIVAASTAITFFAAYGTVCALQKLARGKDA